MTKILKALNLVLYLALSSLGIFFIIQGQVVDKFLSKKSNFAKYDEPLTELPTTTTWIFGPRQNMMYGEDFNITYKFGNTMEAKNLTFGENQIEGTFSVDFETVEQGYKYKITPLGFISGMLLHYKIIYTFKNTTQISQVEHRNWSNQIR